MVPTHESAEECEDPMEETCLRRFVDPRRQESSGTFLGMFVVAVCANVWTVSAGYTAPGGFLITVDAVSGRLFGVKDVLVDGPHDSLLYLRKSVLQSFVMPAGREARRLLLQKHSHTLRQVSRLGIRH